MARKPGYVPDVVLPLRPLRRNKAWLGYWNFIKIKCFLNLKRNSDIRTPWQCPGWKVVVNMGVGKAIENRKILEDAQKHLGLITGQRPVATKAKKSVAGFNLREGNLIGCKVTLRGRRMYEFLDRLFNVALPRLSDFRGISPRSF